VLLYNVSESEETRRQRTSYPMQIRFETREDGLRGAVTEGLLAMGQAEIVLPLVGGVSDEAATRVLRYIGDYVAASGQHILPDETMRYGWSTLRFTAVNTEGTLLAIEELAFPYSATDEEYTLGSAQAIAILQEQDNAVARNGMASVAHHPHRSELAVICRYLSPNQPRRVMVFDRLRSRAPNDSGWFVGCGRPDHDHNDLKELARMHLVYLAELDPKIVYYLAMPEDTRIVFDRGKVIVFAPGEQDGRLDDAIAL
jgi:hypothetical protein